MAQEKLAASLDFDGVLFPRFPAQMALLKWAFLPWKYNAPFDPGNPVSNKQREIVNQPLPKKETGSFNRHLGRIVKPGTREFIQSLRVDAVFGNTGRSNNIHWVEMTEAHLRSGNVADLFNRTYFKPEGVSSDQAKYWAIRDIQQLGFRVRHYDDNAYMVRQLAPLMPDVDFVIVEDLSSGLLFTKSTRAKFPNVSSIQLKA